MVLKFFDVVLKFELPRARCLNFPKNSASVLIRLVLIIGDCVYLKLSTYVYGCQAVPIKGYFRAIKKIKPPDFGRYLDSDVANV